MGQGTTSLCYGGPPLAALAGHPRVNLKLAWGPPIQVGVTRGWLGIPSQSGVGDWVPDGCLSLTTI